MWSVNFGEVKRIEEETIEVAEFWKGKQLRMDNNLENGKQLNKSIHGLCTESLLGLSYNLQHLSLST